MSVELEALLNEAAERIAAEDHRGAIELYRNAIALAPHRADLHHNLGALLARAGEHGEGLRALATAAERRADWSEPWFAAGHVQFGLGRYADAAIAFEAALARSPERLDACYNAARARIAAKHYSLALPHLQRARALAPANERVWFELRSLLLRLDREDDAADDFRRFEPVATPSSDTVVAALRACFREGNAAREAMCLERALGWPYAEPDVELVAEVLSFVQYVDIAPERLAGLYRTYDRLQQARSRNLALLAGPRRNPDSRLRVGYLSADFREHVMGRILLPAISAHDRSRFEVRAYALAPPENSDAMTVQWQSVVDGFVYLPEDDRAAAEAIAADGLDLLVDLMGHSSWSRPGILVHKPARVIVTHLGYHGAVGLAQVDYKVTDQYADTPASATWQIEALLPLSVCALPLQPVAGGQPLMRAGVGIARDAFVFGAFVGPRKLSPRCIVVWRRILAGVPSAVIAFSPVTDAERGAIERRAVGFGLPPDRLIWIPHRRGDTKFNRARYGVVDAVLDTMPYTGGDTTSAALAAGVPVVTRVGARHAERMTYSILKHLGLEQTIALSDDDYVALALRLAQDPAFLAEARTAVQRALADPRMTDPVRYVRALETAFETAIASGPRVLV